VATLTLTAPAKINYLPDVIAKRPDGYHDLRMIMQRVNLCDQISLTLTDTPDIVVTCTSPGAPDGPENIAWKAAKIMLDLAKNSRGVTITIEKNIPTAAGLGGGSSDAATVLMGLNIMLELNIPEQKLMDIGCTLGADVPFFIFKKTALAEGIGEVLTAMPAMPCAWILLVNPGVHVSTAWVYSNLKLTNRQQLNRLPEFYDNVEDICSILSNDLESVTIQAFPVIDEIKQKLLELGALASMMSGSGPTVFGVFSDLSSAEQAQKKLSETTGWFVALTETI
jgi:4-diphosphocytidyl-2-C-methyl-D-erythritol kinase